MELRFDKVGKLYGRKTALTEVSFALEEGVYGLLGPNGAGKSTLMNILTGNLTATSGKIFLDGTDIAHMGAAFFGHIGYMPQRQGSYPGFTTERFLYYIASLRQMEYTGAKKRIDWVMDFLSLEDVRRARVSALSGGMRQRLMLAQAVLSDPDILILDEPTAGLDPRQRIAVRNLIAEISLRKIVILSTHVVSDVEYISKELILLSQGQLLCKAPASELIAQLRGMVWEGEIGEEQLPEVRLVGPISSMAKGTTGVLVRLLSPICPNFPCRQAEPNLDDVYLHYFGEGDSL